MKSDFSVVSSLVSEALVAGNFSGGPGVKILALTASGAGGFHNAIKTGVSILDMRVTLFTKRSATAMTSGILLRTSSISPLTGYLLDLGGPVFAEQKIFRVVSGVFTLLFSVTSGSIGVVEQLRGTIKGDVITFERFSAGSFVTIAQLTDPSPILTPGSAGHRVLQLGGGGTPVNYDDTLIEPVLA